MQSLPKISGIVGLIEGPNSKKPEDTKIFPHWYDTNDCIVGALCQIVDYPLRQGIENFMTAHEAWEFLKTKTYQHGIILKMNTLQTVIRIQFTEGSPLKKPCESWVPPRIAGSE
jgi:hypothetical protein